MVTKNGVIKKTAAESFYEVRRSGLVAIKLKTDDELISAEFVEKGDTVILATNKGQSIRFRESDAREMGRNASGVSGIRLGKGDYIIGSNIIKKEDENASLFVMGENGYGKKTPLQEYKIQKRGGSGIKTIKVTDKTGKLVTSRILTKRELEIVAISKQGQVIRVGTDEIPSLGRQTQGVRIMKLRSNDKIASLTCL